MEIKLNNAIKRVTVAGGGTLGSQIAWQTAFKGFEVKVYDAFEEGIIRSKELHASFAQLFKERGVSATEIKKTFDRITYTTDLAEAVKGADLVSESIPEDERIKIEFYKNLGEIAPNKTIFTTNSSTTIPSVYADYSGRPEKFLALHFANGIWDQNIAEIMGHEGTSKRIINKVVKFSEDIGMVPIVINVEQNGYVLNTLLVPLLMAAIDLLMNNVASKEDIDKTWRIGTKSELGPITIMDLIGMQTLYNVCVLWAQKTDDPQMKKRAKFLKEEYIDKGRMGRSSGRGLFDYAA